MGKPTKNPVKKHDLTVPKDEAFVDREHAVVKTIKDTADKAIRKFGRVAPCALLLLLQQSVHFSFALPSLTMWQWRHRAFFVLPKTVANFFGLAGILTSKTNLVAGPFTKSVSEGTSLPSIYCFVLVPM